MSKKIVLTVTPENNVNPNNKLKDKNKIIVSIWDESAVVKVTHGEKDCYLGNNTIKNF